MRETSAPAVFTVGHSRRSVDEFIRLLVRYGVRQVVDVRTVPRSRRNPQFNHDVLPRTLAKAGIRYAHLAELGGFRRPWPDSPNMGWRNESFRGFADYMQTEEFQSGLDQLLALARREKTAIVCAEAVPWRCHRSLIADALLVRGVSVEEILDLDHSQPHRLTPFAHVDGTKLTYPEHVGVDTAQGKEV
jgi:uncharacterized protein (DUF488 family)